MGDGLGLGSGDRDEGVAAAACGPPQAISRSGATIVRARHEVLFSDFNKTRP